MFFFTRSIFGYQRRELYPLEEWIESATEQREEAISPDEFPIIDVHHHLWDPRSQPKGWGIPPIILKILYTLKPAIMTKIALSGQPKPLVKFFTERAPATIPYMENGFLRDIENTKHQGEHPIISDSDEEEEETADKKPKGHNIIGTVYVESGWDDPNAINKGWKAVPEVSMAQDVATRTNNRICTGIVGHVSLCLGPEAVKPALEAMKANNPNFRGIRDTLAYRPNEFPSLDGSTFERKAYDEKFRQAFALLGEMDLTFDTWLYPENLQALKDLALAFPKTTIILDHIGCPTGGHHDYLVQQENENNKPITTRGSVEELWKPMMKELAQSCPNVVVKLSGLGMPVCGYGFELLAQPPTSKELAKAWKHHIRYCIDCFGIDRCMFASNFPVDKVSTGYTQLFNAFKIIVQDLSFEDRKKLFHDNAVRIYKL